jgi:glycosyltransferase involved in cell wall biosynthesis
MRILIANWNRNVVGGAEVYLQVLLSELMSRGHEVAILHERHSNPHRDTIDAHCPAPTWNVEQMGAELAFRSVQDWKPDVVYVHGLESISLESRLQRNYSAVLFAHNYYGACGSGHKAHSFPHIRPCNRRFGPACLLLYYPRRCGGLNPFSALRYFQLQRQRQSALSGYSAIVVSSEHMRREFLSLGLPTERIHLIPAAVTGIASKCDPPAPRNPGGKILLMGRLARLKGGEYLIRAIHRAMQKIGPLRLVVAGDGPEQPKMQTLARRLRVPAQFKAWVKGEEKKALLLETDLLAIPSLWPEPFGLVGIEAGSLGIPAVGFDVGGISDWLIGGYSGELAPGDPPTVDGLAQAIVRALSDPRHYVRLCQGAWQNSQRFLLSDHLAKLESVFDAVTTESAVSAAACR